MSIFLPVAMIAAGLQAAPATATSIATPPRVIGDAGAWISVNDYPREALEKKQDGTVGFRLTIDSAGNISSCSIAASSGAASLDAATCALVFVRARFEPGRDSAGNAVPSSFLSRIRWVYPVVRGEAPKPLAPVELSGLIREAEGGSVVKVDENGMITACEALPKPYANVLAPPDVCQIFAVGTRYAPPAVAKGRPVKRKVNVHLRVYDVNVR
jgi:TonB family protein